MTHTRKIWLASIGWLAIICSGCLLYFKHRPVPNGFVRARIYQARQLQELDLKYNSWYINGLGHSRIYLGNMTDPLALLSCNYHLKDTLYSRLPFSEKLRINWHVARTRVDSPFVYLYDYKTPSLAKANLNFGSNAKVPEAQVYSFAGMHFDLMQLLSPSSLIVNAYEPALQQKSVQKVLLQSKPIIDNCQSYAHALQASGNFSIDGFLTCNKKQNAVLFAYYYRNAIICLDTNLNLRYIGKTIDTITVAKMDIGETEVDGKKVKTITSRPTIVNKRVYSDGKWMYIQAGLPADNERQQLFDDRVTIDVYQLDAGAYSHSVYLPEHRGGKLTGFAVRGNMLIALYGQYLVSYSINIRKILRLM